MSAENDPALYQSNYDRMAGDRYWTEPWITAALVRRLNETSLRQGDVVWEPAAGRGDMAQVLIDHGYDVIASDLDMSEYGKETPVKVYDFINDWHVNGPWGTEQPVDAIITNPPYEKGMAEKAIRQSLRYSKIRVHAFLLRSEFNHGKKRVDIFEDQPFAFEIALTSRPRWDWWFRERVEKGPRHNFSWFVWDREWGGRPTIFWEGRKPRSPVDPFDMEGI